MYKNLLTFTEFCGIVTQDMDNIEEKLKNLEEWNNERSKVKPYIDIAVDYHNNARAEARWKNYEKAEELYREAIKNYKIALSQNPKYYLQDLWDRVNSVISEFIYNTFNLKVAGDKLKNEAGISDFVNFIDNLKPEEKKYIDPYDIAYVFLTIGDFYYNEQKNLNKASEFYRRAVDTNCNSDVINSQANLNIEKIKKKGKGEDA